MELQPDPASTDVRVRDNRRSIAKQFDRLLADVRQLPGFQDFLKVPSESVLKALAASGPIVVFNVSDIRSDALIVTPDDIRSIHLPLLRRADLKSYAGRFLNATHTLGKPSPIQVKGRKEIHMVLEWLWDVAVGCILDELGFKDHNPEHWSRVWWVGSDLLNILPIHAAGYHRSGPTRTAIDRVISSYTPTLKALKYARERSRRALAAREVDPQKAMLIAWPDSESGDDGLGFVSGDVGELASLLSFASIQNTVLQTPDRNSVLARLGDHHIVHFSCHGYSWAPDPSKSRLLLKNWREDPLTVADITASNISHGQFAFLSACHSASLGDSTNSRLLSESISLSSAIQLAGYPSVIGTLWKVTERDSATVAKDVYVEMLVGNRLESERSAEILHHAVRRLRARTADQGGFRRKIPDDPLLWAPFIHIGV
jgi:CHAT domain